MALYRKPTPEEVARDHSGLVWRQVMRYRVSVESKPSLDLQDLYQGALVQLIDRLDDYDPDKGAFSTWAFPQIRAGIQRVLRQERWAPEYIPSEEVDRYMVPVPDDADIDEQGTNKGLYEYHRATSYTDDEPDFSGPSVEAFLDSLSEEDAHVVRAVMAGRTYADIANDLGVTNSAIVSRLRRIAKRHPTAPYRTLPKLGGESL